MKTVDIKFDSSQVTELSFATIKEGMEQQLFQDYFPKVGPIVADLGGKPLGSFAVQASTSKIGQPKMGAFFNGLAFMTIKNCMMIHDFWRLNQYVMKRLHSFPTGIFSMSRRIKRSVLLKVRTMHWLLNGHPAI